MKYYRELKATYDIEKWTEKCEQIINKIRKPEMRGGHDAANTIAGIFIEEHYYDRLLTLLKLNASRIVFVDKYANNLQDKFSKEILELYENSINEYAKDTGRGIYNDIARYLKKMQKIKDGQPLVNKMIAGFRDKYRVRKAMIAVLDQNFK